jgi:serine/threonine-protein kinase
MPSDQLVGQQVAQYRIESVIGRGGMSVVYLATDLRLGRKIALKILAPDLAEDEAFRARFSRESQMAAGLEHPSIVPVYEAGESDGLLFIAMRYVEGTDLRRLIRAEHGLEPDRALRLLRPVGAALDIAHRRGLIHRDVKPANILIAIDESGSEHPYLSDFGLSKHAGSRSGLTQTGTFMGTVDYVAPEQIQGGAEIDGRADQYSLACVLFEALTGDVPFERDNDVARLFGHIQDAPPRATARRPSLPGAIDDVLARGMAKHPDDRFGTCARFLDAAGEAVERVGASAPAPTVAVPPSAPAPVPAVPAAPAPPPAPVPTAPQPAPAGAAAPPATRPAPRPRSKLPIVVAAAVIVAVVAVVAGALVLGGGQERAGPTAATGPTGPTAATGPTGGVSPAPTGPVAFTDDFSDSTSGWGTRTSASVQTDYADGRYQITSTEGTVLYQELKGHGTFTDVSVRVLAEPLSDRFAYYGVTCRGINPTPTTGRTYYAQITTAGDYALGEYDFSKKVIFEDLVAGTSDAINEGQAINEIVATCVDVAEGVELTLTVNGVFVDSAVDTVDPLPTGRVGLNLDTPKATAVAFDDFVVEPL